MTGRRNSRRLEVMFVAGTHPLAPEVCELADAVGEGADEGARLAAMRELDAEVSERRRRPALGGALGARPARCRPPCPCAVPPASVSICAHGEAARQASKSFTRCSLPSRHWVTSLATPCPAQASDSMAGSIAPPAGEACPAVVPAPYYKELGPDLTSNSVVRAALCCAMLHYAVLRRAALRRAVLCSGSPSCTQQGHMLCWAPCAACACCPMLCCSVLALQCKDALPPVPQVACVYRLPPHRPHITSLLPGAVEEVGAPMCGAGG